MYMSLILSFHLSIVTWRAIRTDVDRYLWSKATLDESLPTHHLNDHDIRQAEAILLLYDEFLHLRLPSDVQKQVLSFVWATGATRWKVEYSRICGYLEHQYFKGITMKMIFSCSHELHKLSVESNYNLGFRHTNTSIFKICKNVSFLWNKKWLAKTKCYFICVKFFFCGSLCICELGSWELVTSWPLAIWGFKNVWQVVVNQFHEKEKENMKQNHVCYFLLLLIFLCLD